MLNRDHGPTNEAGMTYGEYWDAMDEYRSEQEDLRDYDDDYDVDEEDEDWD